MRHGVVARSGGIGGLTDPAAPECLATVAVGGAQARFRNPLPRRSMSLHLRGLCLAASLLVLDACGDKSSEPLIPGLAVAVFAPNATATAGSAVATAPAVKVTTAKGTPIAGISVSFTVQNGGGTINGPTQTTDASGVATVVSWTLGANAGVNTVVANTSSLPEITFTAIGVPGPAALLKLTTAPSTIAANGAAFATQPVVKVQDANSNVVATSNASVTAAIATGGGTLVGTTTLSAINGVATFNNLAIAGTIGARTLTFTATSLTAAISPTITTTAGPAASIAVNAGNNQSGSPGANVSVAPAVKVSDADGNGISSFAVTFAVASGGGSITGGSATSNANGIATVGSWTLGITPGANTLTATATGLTGSPVTFAATGSTTLITTVTPATLTSGISATITGQGFGATVGNNTVTIDGVATTVTTASATSLSVTVPTLPCTAGHDAVVSVIVTGGATGTKNHPVQAASQRALIPGQSLILATAAEARCNELSNTGGLYYVSVYNTNATYSTTGAAFELKGTTGAASIVASSNVVTPPSRAPRPAVRRETAEDRADRAHLDFLERNLEFLKQNGRNWRRGASAASLAVPGGTTASVAVGDATQIRLPNLNQSFCTNFFDITGRVVYVGTKSIIVEDNLNPLAGTIDTTYTQIGNEFDTVMYPILETNYGNPIVNDATLDNNGRIVMVFTTKVNDNFAGIAGFVSSCDFFPRATWASSNQGEYFYATAPKVAGNISLSDSPPRWRWSIRGTVIHEVKHIVSMGERFARNGGTAFEESWLEETLARVSEELYERARYIFAQRANIGYGSALNQVGPYCGVRTACGQARGIVRVFEELAPKWYAASHDYSPLGRIDANDFSFYATGWSIVRWALDASAATEATILKGMTQEPTKTGIANFDARMGSTFANTLPKWTLAMIVDDYPGFTAADATLKQPSWDFRNVFAGYKTDFPTATFASWPLVPLANSYGSFSRTGAVRPGTSAIIELSGTQSAKQVLELKASGSSAAAPAELRVAIVRVQ